MELYHKAQVLESKDTQSRTDMFSKGIALAELLAYIEQARMDEDVAPVFKLADLAKLYSKRLKHEQNNAAIKGDGGAVGLTQSPDGLRRWMVAGPEIVRMTAEFETALCSHACTLLASRVIATSMISSAMKTSLVHHHCL